MQAQHKGFISLIAIVLLSTGIMALSLSVLGAAILYADSVYHHEERIRERLNMQACEDTKSLMQAKDVFLTGSITIEDFGCTI